MTKIIFIILTKQTRQYILPVTFSLCSVYNGLPGSNNSPGLDFYSNTALPIFLNKIFGDSLQFT